MFYTIVSIAKRTETQVDYACSHIVSNVAISRSSKQNRSRSELRKDPKRQCVDHKTISVQKLEKKIVPESELVMMMEEWRMRSRTQSSSSFLKNNVSVFYSILRCF